MASDETEDTSETKDSAEAPAKGASRPPPRSLNDRSLNDRDVTMALLFQLDRHFMAMGGRGTLIDSQGEFLRQRRACGAKRACLGRLYDRRIIDLRTYIDRQVVTRGPF